MGDVAALMRSCGERSLVFVDELGRGTSPKDGTSLAGAMLEKMAESKMSGMFATHLHGLVSLPLSTVAEEWLSKKRMTIDWDSGQPRWTFLLEDGVCTNSLALLTAEKFGLPNSTIERAKELAQHCDVYGSVDTRKGTVPGVGSANDDKCSAQSIGAAVEAATSIVGEDADSTLILPSYMPPPSFEGSSCVYILIIPEPNGGSSRYYVGESDALSRRLAQHRAKKRWSSLTAFAIKIEGGKTSARNMESRLIREMAHQGFNLVSITDGLSVRRDNTS